MDNKSLLISAITLLYRESQVKGSKDTSRKAALAVLDSIKVADNYNSSIHSDRQTILGLKGVLADMANDPEDSLYDSDVILSGIKIACGPDEHIYKSAEITLTRILDDNQLNIAIVSLRRLIDNHLKEVHIRDLIETAHVQLKNHRDKIKSLPDFMMELSSKLEQMSVQNSGKDPAILTSVSSGNMDSVRSIYKSASEMFSDDGLMVTGYQDVNRMLQGGFRRGELVMINALPHKFKTGFSLNLFRQIAMYNKPWMKDPNKKPLLLRISFEDEAELNSIFLWQGITENLDPKKRVADGRSIAAEEMADRTLTELTRTGYHIEILRVNPGEWTYKHLLNKLMEYEAAGFEIHVCMVDYLMQLPTTGCDRSGAAGTDLRDLFRRVRNYCSPRGITFITPHQMSPDALNLIREGRHSLVKEVAEKGFTSGSRQLHQEIDIEINIHIEEYDDRYYFTLMRGKHRGRPAISQERKYVVLPFSDHRSGILDDINGPNTGVKKVGEKPVPVEQVNNKFDFDSF